MNGCRVYDADDSATYLAAFWASGTHLLGSAGCFDATVARLDSINGPIADSPALGSEFSQRGARVHRRMLRTLLFQHFKPLAHSFQGGDLDIDIAELLFE